MEGSEQKIISRMPPQFREWMDRADARAGYSPRGKKSVAFHALRLCTPYQKADVCDWSTEANWSSTTRQARADVRPRLPVKRFLPSGMNGMYAELARSLEVDPQLAKEHAIAQYMVDMDEKVWQTGLAQEIRAAAPKRWSMNNCFREQADELAQWIGNPPPVVSHALVNLAAPSFQDQVRHPAFSSILRESFVSICNEMRKTKLPSILYREARIVAGANADQMKIDELVFGLCLATQYEQLVREVISRLPRGK